MKKIILSFALLFVLLLINSCFEEKDILDSNGNTINGFPRHKTIEEVITNGNETKIRIYDFTYKNNRPNSITFNENGLDISTFNYQYISISNFLFIKKLIVNANQNGQISASVVNFNYLNNDNSFDIDFVETYSNNEKTSYTKYIYINNQLKEIYSLHFENGEVVDSTHYSECKGARPTYIKQFSKNEKKEMLLKKHCKYVYQNGNMIEEYVMDVNSEWQIIKKCYFDLTKENAYYNLEDLVTPFTNVKVFNKFVNDRNLLIKEEYYDLECYGTKYNEPTIVEVIEHIGTHNSTNMIEKLKSTITANCGQKNRFNSEKTFTWE